jgi:hypothetical protein
MEPGDELALDLGLEVVDLGAGVGGFPRGGLDELGA